MFRLIDKTIDIIIFSINWKNYFDRSILVISMTVLVSSPRLLTYILEIPAAVRRLCTIREDPLPPDKQIPLAEKSCCC